MLPYVEGRGPRESQMIAKNESLPPLPFGQVIVGSGGRM